ncbi:MAG: hypothetical protein JRN62_06120 [Nitrososphaerota archaeon]|nr:hypothetical protein [Nitrososphaerota archaeon]
MSSSEWSDDLKRLEKHGNHLTDSIGKVEKYDKDLARELNEEYDGFLRALSDALGEWGKKFERWA